MESVASTKADQSLINIAANREYLKQFTHLSFGQKFIDAAQVLAREPSDLIRDARIHKESGLTRIAHD